MDLKYYITKNVVIRVGHKSGEWYEKGNDEWRQWCSNVATWSF